MIIGFWPVRDITGPGDNSACSDEVNRDLLQQNDLLTATGKTQCLAPTVEFIPTLRLERNRRILYNAVLFTSERLMQ